MIIRRLGKVPEIASLSLGSVPAQNDPLREGTIYNSRTKLNGYDSMQLTFRLSSLACACYHSSYMP